jgi:spermidine synthase
MTRRTPRRTRRPHPERSKRSRHRERVAFLLGCAFVSGVAALFYELTWAKMLSLSFGSTTLAAGGVIAGFLGGMGVGAALYYKMMPARSNALFVYGCLELGIALSAGLLTTAFYALPELIASFPLGAAGSFGPLLIRFGLAFALLLVPAALMGATFPALCTVMIHDTEEVDRRLGLIYGVNTLGAAVGALLAGIVIISLFGLTVTVRIANGLNLVVAIAAILASRRGRRLEREAGNTSLTTIPTSLSSRVTGGVLLISGAATLCYEILWFRALRYVVGNSTYALTTVLVIFLIGLALGAFLLEYTIRRWPSEAVLGTSQCSIGVLAVLTVALQWLVLSTPALYDRFSIYSASFQAYPWWLRLGATALLATGIMLPATALMGLSFPLAARLFLGDVRRIGARAGGAYLLANVGSVAGALLGAAVVLPHLGTIGGTKLVALVNVALGVAVLGAADMLGRRWRIAAAAASAVVVSCIMLPNVLPLRGEPYDDARSELIFVEEGDLGTVQVLQTPDRPERRAMTIDGYKIGWSEGFSVSPFYRKQMMLAYLPMVLEPRAKSALNIGLASGATLDALTRFRQLERIICVEISRSVVRANEHFPESRALEDPRVELIVDDAVHALMRWDQAVDLIVSDGKENPYYPGNAALLCREFYEFCHRRLSPHGLFVQWTPSGMLHSDLRINLRTLCSVFEAVEVFYFPPGSLFVVGSKQPLAGRPWLRGEAFANSPAGVGCTAYDIESVESLLSHWVSSRVQLLAELGEGPISIWDHMILDFSTYMTTPNDWHRARADNLALLLRCHRRNPNEPATFSPPTSPFVQSSQLVREAFLAGAMGRHLIAHEKARAAVAANPGDPAAQAAAALFKRRVESAAEAGPP